MSDILKFIQDNAALQDDPDGRLLGLEEWSEKQAADLARSQGLTLQNAHFDVLHALRDIYRDSPSALNARQITHQLAKRFRAEGGRRYLYQLFPGGPVSQGSRLAGLPLPDHSQDPSFGVTH